MHYVGKIDLEKFKYITEEIITDEVIITDERIRHIIERHGQEFYDKYAERFAEILKDPDYIFKDKKINSALLCKTFEVNGESSVNIVIRLAVEKNVPEYKNSIITAMYENKKRFAQRLRNNIPIYKKP